MRRWFVAVLLAVFTASTAPAMAAPAEDYDDEEELDEEERRPRKRSRARSTEVEVEETIEPDDDTGLKAAAGFAGGSCGMLTVNWLGSTVVGAVVAGVFTLPAFMCAGFCPFSLGCIPPVVAVVGTVAHVLSSVVGTLAATFAGVYAANLAGPRRVPFFPLLAATALPTAALLTFGVILEVPLTIVGVFWAVLTSALVYELLNPNYGYTTSPTRTRDNAITLGVIAAAVTAAIFIAPALALLAGNAVGAVLASFLTTQVGRGMQGREEGFTFDSFSVPDPERELPRRRRRKPVKALKEDETEAEKTVERPAEEPEQPKEEPVLPAQPDVEETPIVEPTEEEPAPADEAPAPAEEPSPVLPPDAPPEPPPVEEPEEPLY